MVLGRDISSEAGEASNVRQRKEEVSPLPLTARAPSFHAAAHHTSRPSPPRRTCVEETTALRGACSCKKLRTRRILFWLCKISPNAARSNEPLDVERLFLGLHLPFGSRFLNKAGGPLRWDAQDCAHDLKRLLSLPPPSCLPLLSRRRTAGDSMQDCVIIAAHTVSPAASQ